MDLLEDLKIPLLNFNFVMIYIIHKLLVLIKNTLNFYNNSILDFFFFFFFFWSMKEFNFIKKKYFYS